MPPPTTTEGIAVITTETEKLLTTAQEIARRAFDDPSEKTVMDLFDELRTERDRRAWEGSDAGGATVH